MYVWNNVENCVYGENVEGHTGIWWPWLLQRVGLEWVRKLIFYKLCIVLFVSMNYSYNFNKEE